jgi:hypothetical protein
VNTLGLVRAALRRRVAVVVALSGAALLASCGPPQQQPLRIWTPSYEFRVTMDPSPPHAREPIIFHIVVLDRKTREFVPNGEGQIFATSQDRVNKYDSFTPAQEPGSYTARLNFITAGDWNVNLQFRRDSTHALEKANEDWVQTVRGARPISERPVQ